MPSNLYLNCPADKECGLNTLGFMLWVTADGPTLFHSLYFSERNDSLFLSSFSIGMTGEI